MGAVEIATLHSFLAEARLGECVRGVEDCDLSTSTDRLLCTRMGILLISISARKCIFFLFRVLAFKFESYLSFFLRMSLAIHRISECLSTRLKMFTLSWMISTSFLGTKMSTSGVI